MTGMSRSGGSVGVVVSGGNIDRATLTRVASGCEPSSMLLFDHFTKKFVDGPIALDAPRSSPTRARMKARMR